MQRLVVPAGPSSFTFLSEKVLLLVRTPIDMGPMLQLYRLPTLPVGYEADGFAVVTDLKPSVIMHFPKTRPSSFLDSEVGCRSHPLPRGRQWRRSTPANGDDPFPLPVQNIVFRADPASRIVTISWNYRLSYNPELTMGPSEEAQVLFSHVSSLLHILDKAEDSNLLEVPWAEWSHLTRLLEDRCGRIWSCPTYGHRFVMPTPRKTFVERFGSYEIVVLDFNPCTIRKELGSLSERPSGDDASDTNSRGSLDVLESTASGVRRLIQGKSYLWSSVYERVPHSTLPYISTRSKSGFHSFEALMMVSIFQ